MLLHNNNPILFKENKQKILAQLLNNSRDCQIVLGKKSLNFRLEQRDLPRCCLILWLLCGPISDVLSIHDGVLADQCSHTTIKAAWVRGKRGSEWHSCFSVPIQSPFWCSAWELPLNAEIICVQTPLFACSLLRHHSLETGGAVTRSESSFTSLSLPGLLPWDAAELQCLSEQLKRNEKKTNAKLSFFSVGDRIEIYLINHKIFSSSLWVSSFTPNSQSKASYHLCYLEETSSHNIQSGFKCEHNAGKLEDKFRLVVLFDTSC